MEKKLKPEDHIGRVYGIYTITGLMPYKNKWNQRLYKGECNECGYEKIATIGDFKNKNVQTCTHFGSLTQEQKDAWYKKHKKQCLYCGKDIPFNENDRQSDYKEKKFCNSSCAASYNNKARAVESAMSEKLQQTVKQKKYCKNCGKEIKASNTFCSNECHNQFKYKTYIDKWKKGLIDGRRGYGVSHTIRKYLFEKYNNKCSKCGWGEVNQTTGKIPLEVHHKDGDYANNSEENLDLLCPNCHSLTSTYKAINKGNGRKDRKKYYLN